MKRVLLTGVMGLLLFSTAADAAAASIHTVQQGDTLYGLAQKYQVSVSELKEWNALNTDSIYVNQHLKTSADAKTTVQPAKPSDAKATTTLPVQRLTPSFTIYHVQKGDSLFKISRKFGVTVSHLTAWNQLKTMNLHVNQALRVGREPTIAKPEPTPAAVKPSVPVVTPVTTAPVSETGNSLYNTVLNSANSLIGTPYSFGGVSPAGFDCSGFIYYAYAQAGLPIYRNSSTGYYSQSSNIANPIQGDLVFFKDTYKPGISHMGILVGNHSFIHASSKGVEITRLDNPYWQQRFAGFRRLDIVNIPN